MLEFKCICGGNLFLVDGGHYRDYICDGCDLDWCSDEWSPDHLYAEDPQTHFTVYNATILSGKTVGCVSY